LIKILRLKFRIILPTWLYLPDDEYNINYVNKVSNEIETYTLNLNNNIWKINCMNKFGEILEFIFLSENKVINPDTLKLKINYSEYFNELYPNLFFSEENIYYPEKIKSYLEIATFFEENIFPSTEESQDIFVTKKIKDQLLSVINNFLETYKFHVAEDNLLQDELDRKNLRTNNIQQISFYDLSIDNSQIVLEGENLNKVHFERRILSNKFEVDVPLFISTRETLIRFKEKLENKRKWTIEILWAEVKLSVFKNDWRKAIILADTLVESIKTILNSRKIEELTDKFNKNPSNMNNVELLQYRAEKLLLTLSYSNIISHQLRINY